MMQAMAVKGGRSQSEKLSGTSLANALSSEPWVEKMVDERGWLGECH